MAGSAKLLLMILTLALLFAVDPVLAGSIFVGFGTVYALIYAAVRRKLFGLGAERLAANNARFQSVAEAFGGIKDLRVLGRELAYVARLAEPSWRLRRNNVVTQLLQQSPRFGLEAMAFGGMMLVIFYLMAKADSLQAALPVLSLFAMAAYRMLPALQQVFVNFTNIRYNTHLVDVLHRELMEPRASVPATKGEDLAPLPFEREIRFEQVSYSYPEADRPAVRDLTLEIPKNTTIAFVGATGAGKTTAVDVLMGLLKPDEGSLTVDGAVIGTGNVRAWQRNIGYVPQHIFLADDTIAGNIAFGLTTDRIDADRVARAAEMAHLMEFVASLPDGLRTRVGERGVKLSGGQLQRVGIARALYLDPQVLVFDEATSAIDSVTETAVMRSIRDLARRKTIVIIAHRISTVRECDRIHMMDHGRIVRSGTYDELARSSEDFRQLARVIAN